jgi:predicted RNA-binding Zn ribbon-like protein
MPPVAKKTTVVAARADTSRSLPVDRDDELAAPGDLEHVRCFVNTCDLELGTELLATPDDLRDWLAVRGLIRSVERGEGRADEPGGARADERVQWVDERVDARALERALALREAFRALLLANATGAPPPAAALGVVTLTGQRATLRAGGDLRLSPAGHDPGLARLLAIAVVAHADGTWQRLKACPGEACQWALYDRTRSRTRRWCSGTKCGARTRSREYRRRQRT